MTKEELGNLLNTINTHYCGKLSQFMGDKWFFDSWFDELKDYDKDLITLAYKRYDNEDFPPSAKYFSITANRILSEIKKAEATALNEVWNNALREEKYSDLVKALEDYIADIPYDQKESVIRSIARQFSHDAVDRISFKEWLDER